MAILSRLEEEYASTILDVLVHIQNHLDDDLSPSELARIACFSQHHFHRVFRAVVGESVMDHVRRIRLERAAYWLKTSTVQISTVAFDSAYGSQEAFTRIFQAYFGLAPSAFRRSHASHLLPSLCGVHFRKLDFFPLRGALEIDTGDFSDLCPLHALLSSEDESDGGGIDAILGELASLVYPPTFGPELFGLQGNSMSETATLNEMEVIMNEIATAKAKLVEARKRMPKETVQDYTFQDTEGREVKLSELFGDKNDLIFVHNMGSGCIYCTMWADGFTGLLPHLTNRAAVVLSSPDKPDVQKRFAEKRNWKFKMVSSHENNFFQDMGFWQHEGAHPGPWPGVSTFHREADGTINRVSKSSFGPGDDFCPTWPFLDMLENGANGWEPKYSYEEK